MTSTTLQTETVEIEKLIYGGDGLTHLASGQVAFVPFSIPGERCAITFDPPSKKAVKAQLASIEVASPHRVTPRCSVFGRCGGCHWQQLDTDSQAQWAQQIVEESLKRIGKLSGFVCHPTLTGSEWAYRNKAQWVSKNTGDLGYYASGSHDVVAFDHCHLISDDMNAIQKSLSPLDISAVTVRENSQGHRLLVLTSDSIQLDDLSDLSRFQGVILLDSAGLVRDISGEAHLLESLAGQTFQVSWQSFFQVNLTQAEAMATVLKAWLEPFKSDNASLVDLYAGVGTWSITLSDLFNQITLVESHPMAVTDAQVNLNRAELSAKATLVEADVEDSLSELPKAVDVVLVDPPRAGCSQKVLDWMSCTAQKAILYISCDPTTLARDLARLSSTGWQVQQVQPIAMFPQTYHIETMVLLRPIAN